MNKQTPSAPFRDRLKKRLSDAAIIVILLTVAASLTFGKDFAASPSSDIQPAYVSGDTLPDRPSTPTAVPQPVSSPTPAPTATPTPTPVAVVKDRIDGGFIELNIKPVKAGIWTQVQWLAGDGTWYDVNGWGGHLTQDQVVLWYVGAEHLRAISAFRWQIYDQKGGTILATTDAFYLPERANQKVVVTAELP